MAGNLNIFRLHKSLFRINTTAYWPAYFTKLHIRLI